MRRLWACHALAALAAVLVVACSSPGARALVVVDGAPEPAHAAIAARAEAFAKQGRAVRVMRVDSAQAAVELAARGEAEIAVVPMAAPLGEFITSGRGHDAGKFPAGGEELRVLEVDGKLHPKVDGAGAEALAAFFAKP